jgi:DNA-binding response OmpR family regulator
MSARIMVVNDTQEILELFDAILTEEGYRVKLYSYNPHALREIEAFAPDLIILDYIVGREEIGWQLLQKLRMNRETAAIPVVICTTATRMVNEIEGHLQSKGIALVAKPFEVDDLVTVVRTLLAQTVEGKVAGLESGNNKHE